MAIAVVLAVQAMLMAVVTVERGIYEVETSPTQRYRIEFHRGSILQRLLHPSYQSPGFARLYDNWANRMLGESEFVDFNNSGQIFWNMDDSGEVVIGMEVVFKGVPPENAPCPGCSPK